jgi:hypothetical protein
MSLSRVMFVNNLTSTLVDMRNRNGETINNKLFLLPFMNFLRKFLLLLFTYGEFLLQTRQENVQTVDQLDPDLARAGSTKRSILVPTG